MMITPFHTLQSQMNFPSITLDELVRFNPDSFLACSNLRLLILFSHDDPTRLRCSFPSMNQTLEPHLSKEVMRCLSPSLQPSWSHNWNPNRISSSMVLIHFCVLEGLLHTVMFHRAVGLVKPLEFDIDLEDVTYVRVDDDSVARAVDQAVESFIDALEKEPTARLEVRSQLRVCPPSFCTSCRPFLCSDRSVCSRTPIYP